jgi:hypothetical protein
MAQPRTRNQGALRDIVERISSVDDLGPYVKVAVFGDNGSGKTRLAATAPDVLIVDINEMGTRSAVGSGAHKIECTTLDDVANTFWFLHSGKHKFKSVAIDTVSALNNLAMKTVLGEASDRDPTRPRGMPEKRHYGQAGEIVKGLIWNFRDLPMHVLFTAQERTVKDQDTGEVLDVTIDLPAGARGALTGAVSVIGYMEPRERKVKRDGKIEKVWTDHMILGPHHEFSALKDRTNHLGPVLTRPTMPKIIEAWNNTDTNEE